MAQHKAERLRVLVDPSGRTVAEIFCEHDLARLHNGFDVFWGKDDPVPLDAFERERSTLDAIVCCGWRFGDVAEMPRLKAILEVGGGPPSPRALDYEECFRRGIRVLNCSPAFGPMVAEMALGMAIDCIREITTGDRLFRSGQELYLHAGNVGTYSLFGRRVGVIGYGSIARNLQPLIAPFGCRVSAFDPWLPESFLIRAGVTPVDLPTLMSESDVIFVLAVPTSENRHMLSRELLELVPSGAAVIMASRAHVVDFDALTDLVVQGRFRAAIDVFPSEPLPDDHPIRRAEHAVLSAHRAGSVRDGLWLIGQMVMDDLEAIASGVVPRALQTTEREHIARM